MIASRCPSPPPSRTPPRHLLQRTRGYNGTAPTPRPSALPRGARRAGGQPAVQPGLGRRDPPDPGARGFLPARASPTRRPSTGSAAGATAAAGALPAWGPRLRPAPPRPAQVIPGPRPRGPPWGRQTRGTGVAAPPRGVLLPLPALGPWGIPVLAPRGAQDTRRHLPGRTTLRARWEEGASPTHQAGLSCRDLGLCLYSGSVLI